MDDDDEDDEDVADKDEAGVDVDVDVDDDEETVRHARLMSRLVYASMSTLRAMDCSTRACAA